MLATLLDVKSTLEITADDMSRDDRIAVVLEAASERILQLTRRLEADKVGRVDYVTGAQMHVRLHAEKRPVDNLVAEYRLLGSSTWTDLTVDVVDPERGIYVLVSGDSWPVPQNVLPSSSDVRFDNMRVTYDVVGCDSGEAAPPALREATAMLAAYWYDRGNGGAASQLALGILTKQFMAEGVPEWVTATLGDQLSDGGKGGAGALLVS